MPEKLKLPEIEIINLYNDGYSQKEIARLFKINKNTIKRRLLIHNVKLRTLSEANLHYHCDDNIFSTIDNHDKAYWLGFIAADGSIPTSKNNQLKIGLSEIDINHLEKFNIYAK